MFGGKVTLGGESAAQFSPVGLDPPAARLTAPENPPTADTEMTPEHVVLGVHGTVLGLTDRLKVFPKLNTTLVPCVSVPFVPLTVTVKLPADDALQTKDAVAGDGGSVTLPGRVQVRPAGALKERFNVPEKLFRLATVIVEFAESVEELTFFGAAAMLKSTT